MSEGEYGLTHLSAERAAKGIIFNIQLYSIHDGPGIRSTVFVKGCPLHCFWCQNPESQARDPELFFDIDKCTGCGKCAQACPEKAVSIVEGKAQTDRRLCRGHGQCVQACVNHARNLMGRLITAGEVLDEVIKDKIFYDNSGGGVTVGGGEPLAQPDFVRSILKLCKNAGMHTAIDTCGYARWESIKSVFEYVDLVLFDFKHMDPALHKKYTGVSNETILENARHIHHDLSIPMLARLPVITGFNDSVENITQTARFISSELDKSVKIHLLPYHRLGETKYQRLEKPGSPISIETPAAEHIQKLKEVFESFGLTAQIGG